MASLLLWGDSVTLEETAVPKLLCLVTAASQSSSPTHTPSALA